MAMNPRAMLSLKSRSMIASTPNTRKLALITRLNSAGPDPRMRRSATRHTLSVAIQRKLTSPETMNTGACVDATGTVGLIPKRITWAATTAITTTTASAHSRRVRCRSAHVCIR